MIEQSVEEKIKQRRTQYLLHSYLYYELDNSIITDENFKLFCDELMQLQKDNPKLCKKIPYHDICILLDSQYTNPKIYDPKFIYPPNIITRAFHRYAKDNSIPLKEAVSRFGLRLLDNQEENKEVKVKKKSKSKKGK